MRHLRSFIVLSVSLILILVPKRAAKACGFSVSPGEYRFWLLQPDLTNQYDLTPFYFASNYLYKGDMWLAKETYPQQNVDEWFKEIKGKATKAHIDSLLNHTDPQLYFDDPTMIADENSFMRYLTHPGNEELHLYMTLSKKVEQIAANPDPWEEEVAIRQEVTKVIDEARTLRDETKSPFIQFRTAFQLVRLYGLTQQYDMLERMYESRIEPIKSNSWVKSAALYQKAIYTSGFEKDYLLSKVFDKGDYNRTPCLVAFDSPNIDSILPYAKNQHEWNVLYAMKVFNYPGRSLEYLQSIYRTEPGYKDISFLLLREINKVEDWLLTNKLTSFEYPAVYNGDYWFRYDIPDNYSDAARNYRNDVTYARELYEFIKQVIGRGQKNALLNLYAAHLCLLLKDYDASAQHLELAARSKSNDLKMQMQIRINRFLLHLENGFDAHTENEFLGIINTPSKNTGLIDPGIMKNQLILYTGRKLIQKGNKAIGLMLLSRTNRAMGELIIGAYKGVYQEIEEIATTSDYDKMLYILDKKNKTPFERFITTKRFAEPYDNFSWYVPEENDGIYWDRNKLLDCKSSFYLRNRRLEESMAVLNQIPDSFYAKEPYSTYIGGNPFFVNVYHTYTVFKDDKRDLNKKEVVREMLYLQQLARKNKDKAAECYFQLANAWYNMSYYGKNWLMVRQWWSGDEAFNFANQGISTFNSDYYGTAHARSLYLKALETTKDPKLAALCHFMITDCDSNYAAYMESMLGDEYVPIKKFRELKNKEAKGYYDEMIEECELYLSFIRQYNRDLRF